MIFLISYSYSQSIPKYMWERKEVTYKQYRDSLKYEYLKYCDSLRRRDSIIRLKMKNQLVGG